MRRLRSALGFVILAILIIQIAAPVRSAAADLGNQSEEFEEDGEPTEESETDGEQIAYVFGGAQAVRSRQPGVRLTPSVVTNASPSAVSRPSTSVSNEMRFRNGIGGPLRC